MSFDNPVTPDEKLWQAESDADTLATAQAIASDPQRMAAAKEAAERQAEDAAERTKALRRVAGKKKQAYTEKSEKSEYSSVIAPKVAVPVRKSENPSDAKGIAVMPVRFLKDKKR